MALQVLLHPFLIAFSFFVFYSPFFLSFVWFLFFPFVFVQVYFIFDPTPGPPHCILDQLDLKGSIRFNYRYNP